ncbi:MAG: molecular chaperone HtpG [Candidatus Delongbacteria bacterium]|nr:molecular chaperone HtpG [Candidatus Delongbacteria bacterium]MCG2760756.1 molecular chaperone HtpG [Candidatus Delongbacteria bacterium]
MTKSTMKFKTEVSQLLELVTHSLYSNKEIFIRELVSNASDALDKLRLEGLRDKNILENNTDFKIKVDFNKDAETITITDNGIGMTKDEIIDNIGTIAKSGTKEFFARLKDLKSDDKDAKAEQLIGQFGVGFYSAFIVSEKIVIYSKKAGSSEPAVKWESDGKEKFSIEEFKKHDRGTEVILYLNKENFDFASEWRIKEIVKKYSDYISYPIVMTVEREEKPKDKDGKEIKDAEPITKYEDTILNSMKAIWQKDKKHISDEDYNEFYKHISHDWEEPLDRIHLSVEGMLSYKALLYLPKKPPYDLFLREAKIGVSLYVKNVFIMDDNKNLLPEYLRFIKGVVDSADLPLNVSREILQEDKMLEKIKTNLVKKVLETLKKMKEKDSDKYLEFYTAFCKVLKEGLYTDHENKDKLAELVMFESTKTDKGKLTSLKDYVSRMPEDQKEIYFIAGEKRDIIENSPHIEKFKAKDYEVLFFTDPIDEFITNGLFEYEKKAIKSIGKGEIDLGDDETVKKEKEEETKKFKSLLETIKDNLKDEVKEVRVSARLTSSAVCLVSDEHGMTPNMEKLFKSMNQEVPKTKRILEINAKHPLFEALNSIYDKNKEDSRLKDYSELLYDQALLTEGAQLKDPVKFAQKMADLMALEARS